MKHLKKLLAIVSDIEFVLPIVAYIVVALFYDTWSAILAYVVLYLVINFMEKSRERINLFGITPPGDDPPPEEKDPSGNQ